ncbi:hypothetical protein ACHAW6_014974 [Cyclotella cf. meneghiniana]
MLVVNGTTVVQGWREAHGSRLWRVVAVGGNNNENGDGNTRSGACQDEAHEWAEVVVHELAGNVYDLPSTEKVIRYHHVSLGFPHGNLVSFPGLTTNAFNDYFPESDETQKGHMKEHRQNISTKDFIKADQAVWKRWEATGVTSPNEAPADYKEAIRKNGCTVELTPPDMHRRNIAEQAIQTRKDHFTSVLAGVDAKFPLHEWDRLIPQATLTLNLLRQSNVSPNVSAYAHHHGQFDYNYMPLTPMGCAVQLHEKPKRRKTFGEHSADGWYIKTSPEHYRCHIIFVRKTWQMRITDTVYFKHKYLNPANIDTAR